MLFPNPVGSLKKVQLSRRNHGKTCQNTSKTIDFTWLVELNFTSISDELVPEKHTSWCIVSRSLRIRWALCNTCTVCGDLGKDVGGPPDQNQPNPRSHLPFSGIRISDFSFKELVLHSSRSQIRWSDESIIVLATFFSYRLWLFWDVLSPNG